MRAAVFAKGSRVRCGAHMFEEARPRNNRGGPSDCMAAAATRGGVHMNCAVSALMQLGDLVSL